MRATEAGEQVPTGTPGTGLPIPIEPRVPAVPPERPTGMRIAVGPPSTPGTVNKAVLEQLTLAFCEHQLSCGRLSAADAAQCRGAVSSRYREAIGSAGCPYDFDVDQVVACLQTIRGRPCSESPEDLLLERRCYAKAMCLPQ